MRKVTSHVQQEIHRLRLVLKNSDVRLRISTFNLKHAEARRRYKCSTFAVVERVGRVAERVNYFWRLDHQPLRIKHYEQISDGNAELSNCGSFRVQEFIDRLQGPEIPPLIPQHSVGFIDRYIEHFQPCLELDSRRRREAYAELLRKVELAMRRIALASALQIRSAAA